MTTQRRNAELVSLLATDFVLRRDPARTIRSVAVVSDPPTDAELTSGLGDVANLPNDAFFVNDDSGGGSRTYGVLTDRTNNKWWRWKMYADGEAIPAPGPLTDHDSLAGITTNNHHNQSHVLATELALGADHTITGGVSGYVLRASGATAANFQQLTHADLGSVGVNDHHNQVHVITGSDHTVTGSTLDVVGLTGTNTLGILTPSSNPGAASAILKSDTIGRLQVTLLGVGRQAGSYGTVELGDGVSDPDLVLFNTGGRQLYLGWTSTIAHLYTTSSSVLALNASGGSVGIGTDSPSALLHVKGSADDEQLIVQGHSTQTASLQEWQNSSGTRLASIDDEGNFAVGSAKDDRFHIYVDRTTITDVLRTAFFAQVRVDTSAASISQHQTGVHGKIYFITGGNPLSAARGVLGEIQNSTASTLTAARGLQAVITNTSTGVITNAYAISVSAINNTGAGSIGTAFGLHIADQSSAAANYAIYTGAGLNRFGDQITIDGSQDVAQLVVKANATQTASLQEWQNSSGTRLTSITSAGYLDFASTGSITTTAGNLTLAPAGDLILGPVGNDVMPDTGYDVNLGSLTTKYLALHAAELWVETLVAQDTIATIGGRILVGPTTSLTRDLAAAATTIYVKHNQMASGDYTYMEANGQVEFFSITSGPTLEGAGDYSYTVTRNLDGTGANDWAAGDAMFNTGAAGDGFIDLYSIGGVEAGIGPAIVGNVRPTGSSSYNDWSTHWAIGNLSGVYGYPSTAYGVAFGEYDASANHITIDSTSGFRIIDGLSTVLGQWAVDGDFFLGTDISAAATTYLSIFATGQTYNGEAMSAGDLLIGDNTASKANIKYSSGVLSFRGGTTTQAYVNTDGTIVAGGGEVRINSAGIEADRSSSESGTNSYKFKTGSQEYGGLYGYGVGQNNIDVSAYSIVGEDSQLSLYANAPAGQIAYITMLAYGSATAYSAGIQFTGTTLVPPSMNIHTAGVARLGISTTAISLSLPTTITGDVTITGGWLKVGEGLYVGSTGTTPTNDAIIADGKIDAGTFITSGTYIYAGSYLRSTSYLQVGTGAHIGSAGTVYDNDLVVDGGIMVGRTADPGAGNIQYTGALQSYKNSTAYTAYAYVPLTTPLTSTSWDGDSKGVADSGALNLATVFGLPANVAAVHLRVVVRATTMSAAKYFAVGHDTSYYALVARTQVNNTYSEVNGNVTMNGSNVYVLFGDTVENARLEIYGYFI